MPNQVDGVLLHTMSGTELSRVRTELHRRRILTAVPPHPVQTNPQPAPHRYLGYALVPTHCQVNVPTSPVRIVPRSCLSSLYQQEAQQGVPWFAIVPSPPLPTPGPPPPTHPHLFPTPFPTTKPPRVPNSP